MPSRVGHCLIRTFRRHKEDATFSGDMVGAFCTGRCQESGLGVGGWATGMALSRGGTLHLYGVPLSLLTSQPICPLQAACRNGLACPAASNLEARIL